MPFKFSNAATATLSSSITSTTTSITVATGLGSLFPSLSAGESFQAVLVDSSNNVEIVSVTSRSADVMTVVRAQEGSAARSFSSGSRFEMRLTSAALTNFVQLDGAQTISGQKTFSQTIIGNLQGNVTGNLTGNVTGNVTGNLTGNAATASLATTASSCSGNSATVTNGVYTVGDQTIGGSKTFTGAVSVNNNLMVGSTANSYLVMRDDESPGGIKYIHANSNLIGFLGGSGNWIMNVDEAGNVTGVGNVTAYSDERLKTNWRDLPADFLDQLANLKMGIYDRKDNGETQVGVGAQGLQRFLPQAVREGVDGFLSVAYGNAAMAACVVLARELRELKKKVGA